MPHAGLPDSGLLVLYCTACIVVALIAVRAVLRASTRRRRLETAEAAAKQSDRVAQLIGALAAARTPQAAIEAALLEPLQALDARAGLLVLVARDGRLGDVAHIVGYGADEARVRAALAAPRKSLASDAVGRGAPAFEDRPVSRAAIPLLAGSRVVAVVQLEFGGPRELTAADRDYLSTLALRGAQALDRTWQLERALTAREEADALRARADQELQERQRMELELRTSETRYRALAARTSRLHWFAAALSESATLEAVSRAVIEHGRNVLGAESGEIALLVDGGRAFETVFSDLPAAAAGAPRFEADAGYCATHAVATRAPVLIGSFTEWQERFPRSAAIAADGGYLSCATLPLAAGPDIAGVAAFYFTAPLNFDDEYRSLLTSVAQHCAQAVQRARLYEEARRARAEAETANRQKDEFVSMLSHDLRAPLQAILGWSSLLQKDMLEGVGRDRALQSIVDNATRQQDLVEQLLDFSRIRSGRLELAIEDVDLRALLQSVMDANVPIAADRGLHLDISTVPALAVRADRRRLEQVFFNLVGNAVKFTPEGGRVAVAVRRLPNAVEIAVADTGPGIPREFLPYVFDPFRQGEPAPGRSTAGVGLGLSIARELVDAHRGSILAESDGPGRGSTFVVTLPLPESAASATVH